MVTATTRLRDRWFNRKAAADYAGISERTVIRMMREPDGLAYVRIGREVMTKPEWVDQYFDKRVVHPNPRRKGGANASPTK